MAKMKFGLSTLMVVVFVAAIICGIVLRGSFLAFGIGFMALAVLIVQWSFRRTRPSRARSCCASSSRVDLPGQASDRPSERRL